jgi:hypothetical protein
VAGLIGVPSDEILRRADRERRAALRRRRRVQGLFALLVLALALGGLLWLEGPYLWEQYHWFSAMGPNVLRLEGERALKPGSEFTECTGGCPPMMVVPAGKFMMGIGRRGRGSIPNTRSTKSSSPGPSPSANTR